MTYLSRLSLTNFRNFVQLELDLPRGVVVFFGSNAQGKTTLMEAVYLLAIARSFHAENEREVVNFEAGAQGGQALVGGIIEKEGERLAVYVGYQSVIHGGANSEATSSNGSNSNGWSYTVRKEIRVSRVRRTAAELVGMVNSVLFTAEDLQLVLGPPTGRRRYLDILISQADNLYLKALQRYQKVVQQRNRLLRILRDGRAGADELAFWDDELVREGAWVTWRRQEAMRQLAPLCVRHNRQLTGLEEDLLVEYRPSVPVGEDLANTEENFRESLAAFESRERITATTVVGPHRDDFRLLLDQVDMGTFASRGQARTLALSLRLAEADYLESVRGEGPIVLLDDILSELDSSRRRRVLEQATRYTQTLITATDLEPLRDFFGPSAGYFQVEGGGVHPVAYELVDSGH
ncbi:MAG: DNA replication/repair protein RecF [Chloroflexi bacterium]|nr:DNA replication/repair protein RecF [Chloroflexota bacterium]